MLLISLVAFTALVILQYYSNYLKGFTVSVGSFYVQLLVFSAKSDESGGALTFACPVRRVAYV